MESPVHTVFLSFLLSHSGLLLALTKRSIDLPVVLQGDPSRTPSLGTITAQSVSGERLKH